MMQFYYQDFYAALPDFIGVDAVREALAAPSAVTAAGELPACPAPVMLRRRLTSLGKLVASALAAVQLRNEEPFVVASSWGDSGKSCQLVSEMTATGDVSPAGFTSSVHNAASGAAGIWLKNHAPAPAVSAGNFTTEAGLTESFLQLQTSESVVLVRAEAPLPDVWDHPAHERLAPAVPYIWALRLTRQPSQTGFSLTPTATVGAAAVTDPLFSDLTFLLSDAQQWLHTEGERGWLWQK